MICVDVGLKPSELFVTVDRCTVVPGERSRIRCNG